MLAACSANLILHDLIILILLGEEYSYEAPRYAVSSTFLSYSPQSFTPVLIMNNINKKTRIYIYISLCSKVPQPKPTCRTKALSKTSRKAPITIKYNFTRGCVWAKHLVRELREFGNKAPREIVGPKRDQAAGDGGTCLTKIFMTCDLREVEVKRMIWRRRIGGMGDKRMHIGYRKEVEQQEDKRVGRWIILKCIFGRQEGMAWTRLLWVRLRASWELL
jgi:hypothetical protein